MPSENTRDSSRSPSGSEPAADFYAVVRGRRSVRRFLPDPVGEEALARIMETGRLAASAANRQPWRFLLLRRGGRARFDGLLKEGFREAPVVILALARPAEGWVRRWDGRNYAWVDVAIAVAEMALAATAEGLGSCWVAAFDPQAAREALGIGPEWEPVAALAVGRSAEPPAAGEKPRKARSEVWEIR